MNTEQERAEFEAWLQTHCDYDDLNKSEIELARDAWQAAIEADRKRRGEPVGYRWRDGNEDTWKYVDGLPPEDSIGHYEVEMLYAHAANKPAEPVKRKRRYAQGTALGEFGIIPMCDQVDDEPVKVPSDAEMAAIWDEAHKPFGGAPFLMSHVEYSRALLARYGKGAP